LLTEHFSVVKIVDRSEECNNLTYSLIHLLCLRVWRGERKESKPSSWQSRILSRDGVLWSPPVARWWSTISFTETGNPKVYTYLPKSKPNATDKPEEKQNGK